MLRREFAMSSSETISQGHITEGFYDTAVAMPFKFELRKIIPPDGGLNKRQRCAEGLA